LDFRDITIILPNMKRFIFEKINVIFIIDIYLLKLIEIFINFSDNKNYDHFVSSLNTQDTFKILKNN